MPLSHRNSISSYDKPNVTFVINVPKDTNGIVVIPNKSNKKKGHQFIFAKKVEESIKNNDLMKKEDDLDFDFKEKIDLSSSSDSNLNHEKELVPLLDCCSYDFKTYKHKPSKLSNYL